MTLAEGDTGAVEGRGTVCNVPGVSTGAGGPGVSPRAIWLADIGFEFEAVWASLARREKAAVLGGCVIVGGAATGRVIPRVSLGNK